MKNNLNAIYEVLKKDSRLVGEDGSLLKNKIYELSMKMDSDLLKLLLSDPATKEIFFVDVDGVPVFDKSKFGWLIDSKDFLPDSFTAFKNKIMLTDENGNSIQNSKSTVITFPYKDCVLEGGQSTEDENRDEIFYNSILGKDSIDTLLDPKVLTNAKLFDADGEHDITDYEDATSLFIRGNNLISLSCLVEKYKGRVKCIYIDPPYNSGKKNSFKYNDDFNHSTWLVFMKNRIELARKLLTPDGVLLVQTDDKEQAYIKVLCDEIFGGEKNYITSFFVQVRYTNKTLAEDSALHKVMETVHVYANNYETFSINKIKEDYAIDKFCWKITELEEPETIEVGGKTVDIFKDGQYKIEQVEPNFDGLKETWATGSLIRMGGTAAEFLAKYLIDRKKEDGLNVLYKIHNMGEDGLGYRYVTGPKKATATRGKFYSGIPTAIKQDVIDGKHQKELPVPNLIYNYMECEGDFGNCRGEGQVDIGGGKKPEQLLKYFIEYFTKEGDIVCDFFSGSGSTAASCMKMNRKFLVCEQLEYGENDTIERLKNVIAGDKTGISSECDWQGGGSFVYCELAENSQKLINKITSCQESELDGLHKEIIESDFVSYLVDVSNYSETANSFAELSEKDKRALLIELIDKNTLYINYADIDDSAYEITDEVKAFNRSFYKKGE